MNATNKFEEERALRMSHTRMCNRIITASIILITLCALFVYGCIKAGSNYVWIGVAVGVCAVFTPGQ